MADARTLAAYQAHAQSLASQYAEGSPGYIERLKRFLPEPMRVLDVGAGTGIELAFLLRGGHDVLGLEPSDEMRAAAIQQHPELEGRLIDGELPVHLPSANELARIGGAFDAVVCSAVLQHLPPTELAPAVHGLKLLVKVKGRVVVSIPSGRNDLDADGRDPLGRLYNQVSESDVRHLFEEEGFCLLGREEESDSLGRDGICWVTLCFERLGPSL